jgi:hypothetical protein
MQIIMAVLSLALLIWTDPASAQKVYSATVSVHTGVDGLNTGADELTVDQVEKILDDASKLLQKAGHPDTDEDDVPCNVTFSLKGPIGTFASPNDPVLFNQSEIDAVHSVNSHQDADFHIRVVRSIMFCRKSPDAFRGCAYPPESRSIIVVHPKMHQGVPAHILWAHEFGHLAGLDHQKYADKALMKCGGVSSASVRVNRRECRCLLDWKGPQACNLSQQPIWC